MIFFSSRLDQATDANKNKRTWSSCYFFPVADAAQTELVFIIPIKVQDQCSNSRRGSDQVQPAGKQNDLSHSSGSANYTCGKGGQPRSLCIKGHTRRKGRYQRK